MRPTVKKHYSHVGIFPFLGACLVPTKRRSSSYVNVLSKCDMLTRDFCLTHNAMSSHVCLLRVSASSSSATLSKFSSFVDNKILVAIDQNLFKVVLMYFDF